MSQTFTDVACTVCGCVCDDLQVTFSDGRVTRAEGACRLARPWFESLGKTPARPVATVEGKPVALGTAIQRAAETLSASRGPLIWGLSRSSTAGQRAAVRLAEQIGATIDTTASCCHGASIMAMQQVGKSTCSLGEVANRADLVVFWGADPAETHPRHFERYSVEPRGLFVPRGRRDRHIVVVACQETETSGLADTFLKVSREADFEVIWALRQLLRGLPLPPFFEAGVPHAELQRLTDRLKNCRYGAVFFGLGLAPRGLEHKNVEALLRLVKELNGFTRFTAMGLGGPGDLTGGDAALCWLTGFPFAVNLARGYPRFNPGEYSANELLERGEVDACLLVGSDACDRLSSGARRRLEQLPTVALDCPNANSTLPANVQFTTAIYGIHESGTAYRMDGVPIPLRRLLATELPADDEVLSAIAGELTTEAPRLKSITGQL